MKKLGEIFKQTQSPKMFYSVNRSDYMLHHDQETQKDSLYQVEMNTISVAFPALSTLVSRLRKQVGFTGVQPNFALENVAYSMHLALTEYSPFWYFLINNEQQ